VLAPAICPEYRFMNAVTMAFTFGDCMESDWPTNMRGRQDAANDVTASFNRKRRVVGEMGILHRISFHEDILGETVMQALDT
jgi:hypothetical protein